MNDATANASIWLPDRSAALERLAAFLPDAGSAYAERRNVDLGRGGHVHVSRLSPWLRYRLLDEHEVVQQVLSRHSPIQAEAFLKEVLWRSYWKGWLELRPDAWPGYRRALDQALALLADDSAVRERYTAVCAARSGLDCMDDWASELTTTGYLHNHARMWFASLWIFTFRLPWVLGADWFLRHLLDGDAASNTLSWRWVAGLQTVGKTYLARPDNIARCTAGRHRPEAAALATVATPPAESMSMTRVALGAAETADPHLRTGLLILDDDVGVSRWLPEDPAITAVAALDVTGGRSPRAVAPLVEAFARSALQQGAEAAGRRWNLPCTQLPAGSEAGPGLLHWIDGNGLQQIVVAWPTQGPHHSTFTELQRLTGALPLRWVRLRREWDTRCWPNARAGFFGFWKSLPAWEDLLDARR